MWFHCHRFAYLLMFLFLGSSAFATDDPEVEQSDSRVVSDSALLAQFHNPTSKTADENWEQYMLRLLKAKFIAESTFNKWQLGEAVTVEHAYTLEESRFETRFTETLAPDGKGTVKSNPKSLEVPYTIRIVDDLEIPAPGDAPQDAVLEGFFSEQRREPETVKAVQTHWSAKRADENWKEYVERLRKRGSVTEKEHETWLEGNAINLVRSIPQRRYVPRKMRLKKREHRFHWRRWGIVLSF